MGQNELKTVLQSDSRGHCPSAAGTLKSMKILVTGACGQLGQDVVKEELKRGHTVVGSGTAETADKIAGMQYVQMDITDGKRVEQVITEADFDTVIHCAAWTAVDAAEEETNEKTVRAVNIQGTENIARACKKADCKMIYISTDYVFDGQGDEPWKTDCEEFHPQNVYGQTKLEGEQAVKRLLDKYFIVRIAWVFGANGNNFVKTMLRLGKTHDELKVVADQTGTPTYTRDLAKLLADMAESDKYGCYHATNEGGYISWYEFACEIFRQAGYGTKVIPVTTEEYGLSRAKRPFNSRLDKSRLAENGFCPLPDWQDALARFLQETAS